MYITSSDQKKRHPCHFVSSLITLSIWY